MKKYLTLSLIIILVLGAGWLLFAKQTTLKTNQQTNMNSTNNDQTKINAVKNPVTGDGQFAIDPQASSLAWEGKKTFIKEWIDDGNIALQSGSLNIQNGQISGGEFIIDMNSISVKKTGRGNGESLLTRHLESPDFFDAAQFPTSEFKITQAAKDERDSNGLTFNVTGNLTIKGITNVISFPAQIYQSNGKIFAQATVLVDRAKWNVRYGSDKFFDNLGDNMINDIFTLTLNLVTQ